MKHQLQMVSEVKMGRTYQCIHKITGTVQFNYIFEELIEKTTGNTSTSTLWYCNTNIYTVRQ